MSTKGTRPLRPFVCLILALTLAMAATPGAAAPPGPGDAGTPSSAATEPSDPGYVVEILTLGDGRQVTRAKINGPAEPPPGYELERAAVAASVLNRPGALTLPVPAYNWVFGCSAVSAAMVAAYFDQRDYPNLYTGPTNGGVMPMNNNVWPTWTDGAGKSYPGNPLVASRNGLDGRSIRGSIDDYWVAYESTAPDPYITGGWAQHSWGDAVGDYMKTSQSAYDNIDGSTSFSWWTNGTPLTCEQMVTNGWAAGDGTYGRKLFYEARGYSVADCYSRLTDNMTAAGFSFANYKALIDAGQPVLLNLKGHTVVGIGYAEPSTVYLNDTWDHATHSMTWGGSYTDLALQAVSVVTLSPVTPSKPTITSLAPSFAAAGGPAFTLTVNGANFVSGSVVRWNGNGRATTVVSATKLTAAISAADIASPGTASITVANPAPGGGVSNAVSFRVGKASKVYLPMASKPKPPQGPEPGYWTSSSGQAEFYVTSDRLYVDRFAIWVDARPAGCGVYKITHLIKEPISGNAFAFGGPFYASGKFVSTTAADVIPGLKDFYIEGCGYLTGGPWPATRVNWKSAAAPSGELMDGAGLDMVTRLDAAPPGVDLLPVR